MIRPHAFAHMGEMDGTAAIVGIVVIVLAVVIGIVLEVRDGRAPTTGTTTDRIDSDDDSELWTFP